MAEIRPLNAIHYAPDVDLDAVVAPPYDVIDEEMRAALTARSPHNVVEIDLPVGDDPYGQAAQTFQRWQDEGVLVKDDEPALWVLTQDYTTPDGDQKTRSGFFAAVKVEDYGPGRIRPHERTHPGPKEDRLRLTRATQANLSPIFSLYSDPEQRAWNALSNAIANEPPFGETTDDDGTVNRLWRVADQQAIQTATQALSTAELLIADGHHRYETARVYAEEAKTPGSEYVLMQLVALEDPGLTIFPTHRLVKGRGLERYEALGSAIKERFAFRDAGEDELAPPPVDGPPEFGYIDSHLKRPFRLTYLGDPPLEGPLGHLDAAVLEQVLLKDVLGLTDDDISHLNDFGYARDRRQAVDMVTSGEYDVAFLLRPTPVTQVQEIAAAGVPMPPKSTYFFPKVPTGLIFNPLT
jgi:uncharacterized protein (DUF1015 family)